MEQGLGAFIRTYPYFLWHLSVKLISFLGIPGGYAAGIANGLYTLLSMFFLNKLLLYFLKDIDKNIVTVLTVILTFVSAIYVPWFNSTIYLGQGSINIYHNPSYFAVKPFSLLAFYLFVKMLDKHASSGVSFFDYAAFAFALFMSVVAKPSFIQVFFFGVALTLVLIVIQKRNFRFASGVMLAFCPSLLWMAMQFFIFFNIEGLDMDGGKHNVYIKLIMDYPNTPSVLFSALIFLAFPVWATLSDIKALKNDYPFILAWICVFIGFAQMLLLHEAGREEHGNFGWGYMNAAVLLWAVSLASFIKRYAYSDVHAGSLTAKIGFSLLFLHLISGVYYLRCVLYTGHFA